MARVYITPADCIEVDPFGPVRVDVDAFAEYDEEAERWRITRGVRINLGNCPFRLRMHDARGATWLAESEGQSLQVGPGYTWDGASAVLTNPSLRLASLVHDIICSRVDGAYPVAGYRTRHLVYYRIARAQGTGWFRAHYQYAGLMGFNWAYCLFTKE